MCFVALLVVATLKVSTARCGGGAACGRECLRGQDSRDTRRSPTSGDIYGTYASHADLQLLLHISGINRDYVGEDILAKSTNIIAQFTRSVVGEILEFLNEQGQRAFPCLDHMHPDSSQQTDRVLRNPTSEPARRTRISRPTWLRAPCTRSCTALSSDKPHQSTELLYIDQLHSETQSRVK